MAHRCTVALLAAPLAALTLGACGGGSDEPARDEAVGAGSLELVGFLPQDRQSYSTIDLTTLKEGLDLPPSADPFSDEELTRFAATTFNGVYASGANPAVVKALELPSATALASAAGGGVDEEQITAIATPVDPGGIREALLESGFTDRDGVLEGSGAAAVSFEDGVVLVSDSGELLRALGDAASEPPLQVQRTLEGDATLALRLDGRGCVLEQGIATNADGSGTLIFVVDGEPDPSSFSRIGSSDFGEPEVDGDQLRIPITLDEPESPVGLQASELPGYDCPS